MLSVASLLDDGDDLKRELLQKAGYDEAGELSFDRAEDAAAALRCARIACLNTDEAYFLSVDEDFRLEISPRSDAAALALLYTKLREAGDAAGAAALALHAAAISRAAERPESASASGTASEPPVPPRFLDTEAESADAAMMAWAERQGIRGYMRPASFGQLRGAAASAALQPDEPALEVPAAALITLRTAMDSDLGPLLQILPGLDADTALTLWTMYDRADAESPRGPFWRALPATIATGVTMPLGDALEGLQVAEEARALRGELEARHAQLFPALFRAAPGLFDPPEAFDLGSFLWAAQLWMAYAIKVLLPGESDPEAALVPVALLANHSLRPDIVRFSRVDADDVLRLRVIRHVAEGAELTLSYGPLPNAQLLLFYGFTLSGNPFDSVPLGFELPDESEGDQATGTAALRAALLRWAGVGLHEHSLGAGRALSPRLLTALRLLTAPRNALERVAAAAGVTGAGALPTGVGAACAEGEGEEGALLPDPAAAAGTREGALRAAAVEAACGSEDAAAALEATVDAHQRAVQACLSAVARRARKGAQGRGGGGAAAPPAASAAPAALAAQQQQRPSSVAGKAGGKRKGKAGSKGTEAQAGNRDSGAGGAKGGGEGMGKALGGLAPFAQQFLEGQKACLDSAFQSITAGLARRRVP